jgi:hypothetical protein
LRCSLWIWYFVKTYLACCGVRGCFLFSSLQVACHHCLWQGCLLVPPESSPCERQTPVTRLRRLLFALGLARLAATTFGCCLRGSGRGTRSLLFGGYLVRAIFLIKEVVSACLLLLVLHTVHLVDTRSEVGRVASDYNREEKGMSRKKISKMWS